MGPRVAYARSRAGTAVASGAAAAAAAITCGGFAVTSISPAGPGQPACPGLAASAVTGKANGHAASDAPHSTASSAGTGLAGPGAQQRVWIDLVRVTSAQPGAAVSYLVRVAPPRALTRSVTVAAGARPAGVTVAIGCADARGRGAARSVLGARAVRAPGATGGGTASPDAATLSRAGLSQAVLDALGDDALGNTASGRRAPWDRPHRPAASRQAVPWDPRHGHAGSRQAAPWDRPHRPPASRQAVPWDPRHGHAGSRQAAPWDRPHRPPASRQPVPGNRRSGRAASDDGARPAIATCAVGPAASVAAAPDALVKIRIPDRIAAWKLVKLVVGVARPARTDASGQAGKPACAANRAGSCEDVVTAAITFPVIGPASRAFHRPNRTQRTRSRPHPGTGPTARPSPGPSPGPGPGPGPGPMGLVPWPSRLTTDPAARTSHRTEPPASGPQCVRTGANAGGPGSTGGQATGSSWAQGSAPGSLPGPGVSRGQSPSGVSSGIPQANLYPVPQPPVPQPAVPQPPVPQPPVPQPPVPQPAVPQHSRCLNSRCLNSRCRSEPFRPTLPLLCPGFRHNRGRARHRPCRRRLCRSQPQERTCHPGCRPRSTPRAEANCPRRSASRRPRSSASRRPRSSASCSR